MLSPAAISADTDSGVFRTVITRGLFKPVPCLDYDRRPRYGDSNILGAHGGNIVPEDDTNSDLSVVPCISDSDTDKEVDDITGRLQELQERRQRMVQRWRASGNSGQNGSSECDQPCYSPLPLSPTVNQVEPSADGTATVEDQSRRMDVSLQKLRQELVSLLSGDDAIFAQLLTIRRSISQLKHQYFEDLYEEAELQLLASPSNGSLRLRRNDSVLKPGSRIFSRFPPCETSEDSGVSLESSGISSPSLSPSPVTTAITTPPTAISGTSSSTARACSNDDPTLRRNSVTFPPSRGRQNRSHNGPAYDLDDVRESCQLEVSPEDDDLRKMATTKMNRRSYAGLPPPPSPPPAMLVRSRSITFLPRGVLVRREDFRAADDGATAQPNGEVFV